MILYKLTLSQTINDFIQINIITNNCLYSFYNCQNSKNYLKKNNIQSNALKAAHSWPDESISLDHSLTYRRLITYFGYMQSCIYYDLYIIVRKKSEITHFEQGKLCVKNFELCAKLCANSNKKEPFFFHITYFSRKFYIKKGEDKEKVIFHFFSHCKRILFNLIHAHNKYIETLKHITHWTFIRSHYTPNLCTKNTNFAPKLCTKNTNYAPKLCAKLQIKRL